MMQSIIDWLSIHGLIDAAGIVFVFAMVWVIVELSEAPFMEDDE